METKEAQKKVLHIFAGKAKTFALSGGTALGIYYLKHRSSADLDFFSPEYNLKEINELVGTLKKALECKVKLETDFVAADRGRVRFYSVFAKGLERPLKIDFIEDVLFDHPPIKKINGLRIYDVKNIYLQKLAAVAGTRIQEDEVGREIMLGRRSEARDAFDIYMLSKKIIPLHKFLAGAPQQFQRGVVHWYRTFSRQDLKIGLLDLEIYDKKFDAREMIVYLENEIKKFMQKAIE